MERNGDVLRSVAWAELFPWLNIYKTFWLAIGFRALVMSAVAVVLTVIGWWMCGRGVSDSTTPAVQWLKPFADNPLKNLADTVPDKPMLPGGPEWMRHKDNIPASVSVEDLKAPEGKAAVSKMREGIAPQKASVDVGPMAGSWTFLSQPLWEGFGLRVTFGNTLRFIGCGLWALAVWAFFGAAITRIAVVQLAANERITWGAALRYACSKFFAYFFAPLLPLIAIALAAIPVLLFGLLLKFGPGVFFVGLIWPVFLICGLIISLILLGLIFGWPLMWPTISTEGTDSFDALSRSYAYVLQRPLHYLFYIIVAAILGTLGWFLVNNFAAAIIWATYWAASWGAGAERIAEIMSGDNLTGMGYAGACLIHFWVGLVKLLAVGFGFSFFWNANSAIYLLLRRDADATEMDEVYLDADESESRFGLPKIILDDSGAPEMEEKPQKAEEKAPVEVRNTPIEEKSPEAAPLAETGDGGEQPPSL